MERELNEKIINFNGIRLFYDLDGDKKDDIAEVYLICDNNEREKIPYGLFNFKTKKLLLDNNPLDGTIDEVVTGLKGRSPFKDAPNCVDVLKQKSKNKY